MTTNHKPATPLPWESKEIGIVDYPDESQGPLCEVRSKSGRLLAEYARGNDAAYIAHAANAYPRLVEALREVKAVADAFDEDEGNLQPILVSTCDKIRALLRELGEE